MHVPYNRESFFLHIRDAHRTGADPHHVNTYYADPEQIFFFCTVLKIGALFKMRTKNSLYNGIDLQI